jgi:rRNA maturation protein Nop10
LPLQEVLPLAVDEAAEDGNSWIHPRRGKNPKSLWAVFSLKCPHCDERIKVVYPRSPLNVYSSFRFSGKKDSTFSRIKTARRIGI